MKTQLQQFFTQVIINQLQRHEEQRVISIKRIWSERNLQAGTPSFGTQELFSGSEVANGGVEDTTGGDGVEQTDSADADAEGEDSADVVTDEVDGTTDDYSQMDSSYKSKQHEACNL